MPRKQTSERSQVSGATRREALGVLAAAGVMTVPMLGVGSAAGLPPISGPALKLEFGAG